MKNQNLEGETIILAPISFFPLIRSVIKPLFDLHTQGWRKEGDVKRKTKGELLIPKEFMWGLQCSCQKLALLYHVCNKDILSRLDPVYQVPYGDGKQKSTQFYFGGRLSESHDTQIIYEIGTWIPHQILRGMREMRFACDSENRRQSNLFERGLLIKLRNLTSSTFTDYPHQGEVRLEDKE